MDMAETPAKYSFFTQDFWFESNKDYAMNEENRQWIPFNVSYRDY